MSELYTAGQETQYMIPQFLPDQATDHQVLFTLARLVTGNLDPTTVPESQLAPVISLAVRQGLGPMLLWAVRRGLPVAEEDPLWLPLIESARQTALNYALLENTRQRMASALVMRRIPAIWLKGIALAHTVYPEPRLRPMLDLDVLVHKAQRERVRQIAEGLGFQVRGADFLTVIDAPEILLNHDQLLGGPGGQICLELHFRLLGREGYRLLPQEQIAWFWEQTQEPSSPGEGFQILKPEAHLLYLCAHAILQHGEAYLKLLQLLDLHQLSVKHTLDWQLVLERAYALGWSYAVERALVLAVGVFGTPVPDWVIEQLHKRRSAGELNTTAKRLRIRAARWEEWKSIFHSLPLGQRLRLIWSTLFPPGSYLRELYKLQPGQSVVPYYFYRWWDAGREVARALGGLRSRRT